MLQTEKKLSAADMLSLQNDTYSELDRFVADRIVTAVDHAKDPSPQLRKAGDLLRNWDGRMSADSAAPAIATSTRDELKHLLLEPNPHWDGPKGGFRRITVRAIENTAALEANLLSGTIDIVAGELGIALQRLKCILIIIDDGDLHESFSFSDLLCVLRALCGGKLFAVFANPVISSAARNPSSHSFRL